MKSRERKYLSQSKWLKAYGMKLHRYPKFYWASTNNNNEIVSTDTPCSGETVTVTIKAENNTSHQIH